VGLTKGALAVSLRALLAETVGGLSAPASRIRTIARATATAVNLLESVGPTSLARARDRFGELRAEFEPARHDLLKSGLEEGLAEYVAAGQSMLVRSIELLLPMSPNATTVLLPPSSDRPEPLEPVAGTPLERVRLLPTDIVRRRMTADGQVIHKMADLVARGEARLERAGPDTIDHARAAILPLSQVHLDLKEPYRAIRSLDAAAHSWLSGLEALYAAASRQIKS
jgi:hypothetical protein